MLLTGFGLFLALTYQETISAVFDTYLPLESNGVLGRVIYTLVVTVIIVYGAVMVERALDGK